MRYEEPLQPFHDAMALQGAERAERIVELAARSALAGEARHRKINTASVKAIYETYDGGGDQPVLIFGSDLWMSAMPTGPVSGLNADIQFLTIDHSWLHSAWIYAFSLSGMLDMFLVKPSDTAD